MALEWDKSWKLLFAKNGPRDLNAHGWMPGSHRFTRHISTLKASKFVDAALLEYYAIWHCVEVLTPAEESFKGRHVEEMWGILYRWWDFRVSKFDEATTRKDDFVLTGLLAEVAGIKRESKGVHMRARTACQLWFKEFFKGALQAMFNAHFDTLTLPENIRAPFKAMMDGEKVENAHKNKGKKRKIDDVEDDNSCMEGGEGLMDLKDLMLPPITGGEMGPTGVLSPEETLKVFDNIATVAQPWIDTLGKACCTNNEVPLNPPAPLLGEDDTEDDPREEEAGEVEEAVDSPPKKAGKRKKGNKKKSVDGKLGEAPPAKKQARKGKDSNNPGPSLKENSEESKASPDKEVSEPKDVVVEEQMLKDTNMDEWSPDIDPALQQHLAHFALPAQASPLSQHLYNSLA
ncbi:hypothetical protein ARMGADRAFT_1091492 [Armillaria gallica]|uniref:Uncharacterized protein n=1 Tax=Armillaria gallica TaxID=47427 RepID=A0A2H3CPR0_ARMGA|nr:hypothetical protein ARMGADRAFT_1091492 [Armillaria gallica]